MSLFYAFITLLALASAHSWVECTDYRGTITGHNYQDSQCKGWPRGVDFGRKGFGNGAFSYLYHPGKSSSQTCQNRGRLRGDPSKTQMKRKTRYTSGQRVRVVWPAKNHANAKCWGMHRLDLIMKLYMNPTRNPKKDLPNRSTNMAGNGYVLVKDWLKGCKAGQPGCGFMNCPGACKGNKDTVPCFGDFVVPKVKQAGYYTFQWYWKWGANIQSMKQNDWPRHYITCWDAWVEPSGKGGRALPPPPARKPASKPARRPAPRPASKPAKKPASKPSGRGNRRKRRSRGDALVGDWIEYPLIAMILVNVSVLLVLLYRSRCKGKKQVSVENWGQPQLVEM